MANEDGPLRLHRGLVATMNALHGTGVAFPPEPPPSGKRKGSSPTPKPEKAAKPAAPAPTLAASYSADEPLSDGQLWGWWPTREHFSSPGSNPWGVSRSLARLETAIDAQLEYADKMHPIARFNEAGLVLERKREKWQTFEMKSD